MTTTTREQREAAARLVLQGGSWWPDGPVAAWVERDVADPSLWWWEDANEIATILASRESAAADAARREEREECADLCCSDAQHFAEHYGDAQTARVLIHMGARIRSGKDRPIRSRPTRTGEAGEAKRERDEAHGRIDMLNRRHEEDEAHRQRVEAERDELHRRYQERDNTICWNVHCAHEAKGLDVAYAATMDRDAARFLAAGWHRLHRYTMRRLRGALDRDDGDDVDLVSCAARAHDAAHENSDRAAALRSQLAQLDALGSALAEAVHRETDAFIDQASLHFHETHEALRAWDAHRAETGATRGEGR